MSPHRKGINQSIMLGKNFSAPLLHFKKANNFVVNKEKKKRNRATRERNKIVKGMEIIEEKR